MAGKYKLDRTDVDKPDAWSRRAAHKTLKSALIELGRIARRDATVRPNTGIKPRYAHYRIILDGVVIFTVSGQDACNVTGDEQVITG